VPWFFFGTQILISRRRGAVYHEGMQSLFTYIAPPSPCSYLPDQRWSLEYEMVQDLGGEEYMQRMLDGWRRFGSMLFRPRCPRCTQCQALRVDVTHFQPSRSQRRAWARNDGEVRLHIGPPHVTRTKLKLYDRYHAFQSDAKGWPEHPAKDAASYRDSFVNNPAFTEEWTYFLDDRLVGVGYVDRLPGGLSAIYFFYDPEHRDRSLGTWNVLNIIDNARASGLQHVYLGYYVPGCPSLEYKASFRPNQIRWADGRWADFFDCP
jgi:arginyl-tRNA--protein-N-Asp/Glu arginylyltransferase